MNKFLILGYPRSGTNYAAIALHKVGFYVCHERDESTVEKFLGRKKAIDGVVTGLFMNAERKYGKYNVIFHQTRHPLKVISSACRMSFRSMTDLWETCELPGKPSGSKLYRVMKTWLKFTEQADTVCYMRYQVENMQARWRDILELLDIPMYTRFPDRMHTYMNTYGDVEQLSWEQLSECDAAMAQAITQRSKEYGYEVDSS